VPSPTILSSPLHGSQLSVTETETAQQSKTSMATTDGTANGTDLGQQLEQLAAQLTEAVKEYKSALATGNDFLPRINVLKAAQQITYAAKKPEEQWLDQSVWVRFSPSKNIFLSIQSNSFLLCSSEDGKKGGMVCKQTKKRESWIMFFFFLFFSFFVF
jgi:hypothetical protein